MKKRLVLLLACVMCGAVLFTGCSNADQGKSGEASKSEASASEASASAASASEATASGAAETAVAEKGIEEKIIGSWIVAERADQPALTNEKGVFTFVSPEKAYMTASFNARPELGNLWVCVSEADVDISGDTVTLSQAIGENKVLVSELTISDITDTETRGSVVVKQLEDGKETLGADETIRLVKVDKDYSKDLLGTWEGRCTSEGSAFDDGQEHRWQYNDDGTYVYYVKDGDDWVPGGDEVNEYIVGGNLLCTRWVSDGDENREWWEISIDGDTMNWTALRKGEDGKTFTVTFEMTKVKE